jgi:putative transposase
MRQRLRDEQAGATYHVLARGVDRRRIFVDDEDYEAYTELLRAVVRRQGWRLLCYCLMPNHVHLMIETPDQNLANGMQWLQSLYARYFNKRHCRLGHLFENRYKSPRVETDEAFIRLVGYRAREWRWGSHAGVHSGASPAWVAHERLLDRLEEITGARCYEELVATRECY